MAFITARQIHSGLNWLPIGTIIEITDEGEIIALHDNPPSKDVIFYEGIIAPGFVNAHCHLELSHMKGLIPEHTGLIPFLKNIPLHRNDFSEEQKKAARHNAYKELIDNGIVAVGDISNVSDTLDIRALGELHIHTFVESLGFSEQPHAQFQRSVEVYKAFEKQQSATKILRQSIVPHAPYTVSASLFKLIDAHKKNAIISIHNQESKAEDEYYLSKTGPVTELLQLFGINDNFFTPSGKSTLQTYLEWLSPTHPFIFIHNTYTTQKDVQIAQSVLGNPYWCLCPNANLYIENRLPDVKMFIAERANMCIGTDSLSSNHQLSILSELNTLKTHFPELDWQTLIRWGTYNGACALQMDQVVGCLKPGTKPGIILITGLEENNTAVKRIL